MFGGILEDERVCLRALEMSDLDTLYGWENDSSVWLVSGTTVPFSRELLSQYIQCADQDIYAVRQLRLVIQSKSDSFAAVGAVDLFDFDPMNLRAGVGILIDPAFRMNGFALSALNIIADFAKRRLGLHQLFCNITADNVASLSLFKSAGYVVAGCKSDWVRCPDGWLDEVILQKKL